MLLFNRAVGVFIVSIERNDKKFINAYVDGPVDILFDGRMYISDGLKKAPALKKALR